jgi:hypothetical protein
LTLSPNSVTAATNTNIGFHYTFTNSAGDSPKDVTTILPPGLIANANLNGGACLATPAASPTAACQVASGSMTSTAYMGPVSLYLVQAPSAADIAGVDLVLGSTPAAPLSTAAVTVRPAGDPNGVGLNIAFTGLPNANLTDLNVTFSALHAPTSCAAANVIVRVDDQSSTAAAPVNTPLTVTGCASLAFNTSATFSVKRDAGDTGAEVISQTSQPGAATESATKTLELDIPGSVQPNAAAVLGCFSPAPACNVGTASATSPLVPNAALSNGTITLGGANLLSPTLTITFPVLHLSLTGQIDVANNRTTFNNLPDLPLTSLRVDIVNGQNGLKAFATTCAPGSATFKLTPWNGNATVTSVTPIAYQGCPASAVPGSPKVSKGSVSGLSKGHPKLKFTLGHGANAPNVVSVAVSDSQGLSFRKCVKKGKKPACAGLALSGATIKKIKLSGGRLTIIFSPAAGQVSVTAQGPLLSESLQLLTKARKHKVGKITFTFKVIDAKGKTTTFKQKLNAS